MAMKRLSLSLGLVLCLALTRFAVNEAIHEDALITHLPGFSGKFPSRHYSGYVLKDMRLFYYFIVSERQPETDPVVLWLNGGPGCSSFDGFIYEHGPFNFKDGISSGSLPRLHLNPYSWSKVSNIIYLDSPVGVGLSYSKHKTKYKNDDIINALDTHMFLIKWFELYPEFVENPFYISGESYAGVYIPTLASEIAEGIENGFEPKINFKGYMIGNGVVADPVFDTDVLISYIHSMGLISDNLFEDIQSTCKGKRVDQRKCLENLKKAVNLVADLNKYHILEPCYHPPKTNHENIKRINTTLMRKWMFGHGGVVSRWIDSEGRGDCINDELATAWLNNEEVRKAIHTEPVDKIGRWEMCTRDLDYNQNSGSMIPYHRKLTKKGYLVLIYSGNQDMVVPFTGSQAWVRSLGYDIVDEWRPWIVDDQVAGYLQGYHHGLIFMTIKGAGHRVPESKPKEALHFYRHWLEGKPI
ncbi:serine carboxypeptidase-like 20 [Tripterygium wilfordii]|uniref:serine carboxypeptidase-like 20 n=1 Tax=Tripterygium wilfordii TaxID=458696 RepID=UPI0018F84B4D|nr:serine carboxypeptidase-like 20 [Tripterygium wilfordii]